MGESLPSSNGMRRAIVVERLTNTSFVEPRDYPEIWISSGGYTLETTRHWSACWQHAVNHSQKEAGKYWRKNHLFMRKIIMQYFHLW